MKNRTGVLLISITAALGVLTFWGRARFHRQSPTSPAPSTPVNPVEAVAQKPPWTSEPVADPPATETLIRNAAVQTYEIPGGTWQELAANVETFGTNQRGAPSKTTYSFVWHPGMADGNAGLTNGTASAEIVVTLPHWSPTSNSSDEALQWWSYFIRHQAEAQQVNVDWAIQQAESVTQTMRSTTRQTAEEEWKAINARIAENQNAYDAAHGHLETDLRFEPSLTLLLLPESAPMNNGAHAPAAASGPAMDAGPGFPSPLPHGSASFSYNLPLQTLDGMSFSLESKRGQVVVLNFWATWCGFCRTEEPSFESLVQQVQDQNIVFAFVTTEPAPVVKKFLDQSHWTIPVYLTNSLAASPYEDSGIPETLILSKTGDVVMKVPGARNWAQPQVAAYLRMLANE